MDEQERDRRERFFSAVEGERMKQDAIWGGVEHDQEHAFTDWADLIEARTSRLGKLESGHPNADQTGFSLLIEIAALACAAYEAECGP